MYVRRRGLYLPTGTADAADLRGHLSDERAIVAVNREHEWVSIAQDTQHRIRIDDVAEAAARAKRTRKQRAKDATEDAKLADLYRAAKAAGHRASLRAKMNASAEVRAVRLAKMRTFLLIAGLPVLLAFAAWSTTGVQAGFAKLMDLSEEDPGWWSAWAVEPALITIVAGIIIGRAILRSSGGDTDRRADLIEWAALGSSLALNVFGGWHGEGWSALGAAIGHSLGPIGAAGTAYLMGVFDAYIAQADPNKDAKRLDELDLDERVGTHSDDTAQAPSLPDVARLDYALPPANRKPAEASVARGETVEKPRKPALQAPREKPAAQPAASGYARSEDPGMLAARAYLDGKYASKRQAADAHGVSEGTVRNRIKDIESRNSLASPAGSAGGAQTPLPTLPLNQPKPAVTHGVNGHHSTPSEEI